MHMRKMMQGYTNGSDIPHTYNSAPPSSAIGLLQELEKTGMEDVEQDLFLSVMSGNLAGLLGSISAEVASAISGDEHQDFSLLSGITPNVSVGKGEEFYCFEFGNIARSDEPYQQWNLTGSMDPSAQLSCAYTGCQVMPEIFTSFMDSEQYHEQFGRLEEAGPGQGIEELEQRVSHEKRLKQLSVPITAQIHSRKIQEGFRRSGELLADTFDLTKQSAPMSLLPVQVEEGLDEIAFGCNRNIVADVSGVNLQAPPLVATSLSNLNNQTISPSFSCTQGSPATTEQVPVEHSSRSAFQAYKPSQSTRLSKHKMSFTKKPSIHYWVKNFVPKLKSLQVLQTSSSSYQSAVGLGKGDARDGTSYDHASSDRAAHDYKPSLTRKMAEQRRRNRFKHSLENLRAVVPTITKKDNLTVIVSATKYIMQLKSVLKKVKEAAPGFVDAKNAATMLGREGVIVAKEQDLGLHHLEIPFCPSSTPATRPVVVVEDAGEALNLRVEANHHARSLPQLLNVLENLDLDVVTLDFGLENGRFRATVRVKTPRHVWTSNHELGETICCALEDGGFRPPSRSQELL